MIMRKAMGVVRDLIPEQSEARFDNALTLTGCREMSTLSSLLIASPRRRGFATRISP